MITYLYWAGVVLVTLLCVLLLGLRLGHWKSAIAGGLAIVAVGGGAYWFHFQQIFVKRWGGVMTIRVPAGQRHITATWKDDNLWVENYDPATNTCHFNEYAKGNLLEGRVLIKDCNPLAQ